MNLRCPHCGLEINPKEIVALESWRDDESELVRDVVLACPECAKPLAPSRAAAESRAPSS